MASNEGHIHWSGSRDETINYLGQELRITSEVSNMPNPTRVDPIGTLRIRTQASGSAGLILPTDGWQTIPGTSPVLEARVDAIYPIGYIRIRAAV